MIHQGALALMYLGLVGVAWLVVANAIGHIRMALWNRRHRRVVNQVARRSSTTLEEHYSGRRPIW